jgi:pantoate--beta-alanine ligase
MNQPFHPGDRALLTTSHGEALAKIIERWKIRGEHIAFVPTMGALHDGHLSLMKIAAQHADRVVVSIFVNPTQFAPHEDFDAYPRDVDSDLMLLNSGIDLVYTPTEDQLYPNGRTITTRAGDAAKGLESDFRPHFFDGVTTVVKTLFDQIQPDIAVFGEKDFQQLQVIREMVSSLKLPIQILGGPIVRDEHGLALSSRNAYLSEEELEIARMLNQIIFNAAFEIQNGADEQTTLDEAKQSLLTSGFDKVDYVASRWGRVLAAAWLGKTRLIDNCAI